MTLTAEEIRAWTPADPPSPELADVFARPEAFELVVELAHDLRTPLASVLVIADLLQSGRSGPLSALQQEQVRLMYSAVRSLCAVTEDVMEAARSGGESAVGARVPFSVSDVLTHVRDVARPMAAARGLELRVLSDLHEARLGHPRAVERVLLNLVTNAIKFTDRGHVEVSVLAEGAEPEQVVFSVRDTGRGITAAAADVLLEPFTAATAVQSRRFSGAGIGLMVCRRLVAAMGASLHLQSEPARGSRFTFTLALPFARD